MTPFATARGMIAEFFDLMTGPEIGVAPCAGSMAPAEELCGRAQAFLASTEPADAGDRLAKAATDLRALQEWMRVPDDVTPFDTPQLVEWLNARPTHVVHPALFAIETAPIWPKELTPDLRYVLGLMCFDLARYAHVYRLAGEFVAAGGAPLLRRAEDEQAFMLHKLVGYLFGHGPKWAEVMTIDLARALTVAKARATAKPDGDAA